MGIDIMMSILRFVSCILILMMIAGCPRTGADFAQDRKECQDQLIVLRPCLGFIGGEEKKASSACCVVLVQNFNQTRRCLCILVRDRNDPGLGFKVNGTLALSLPFRCHIPANETECLDFLKIDPQSPGAQIFQQFANSTAEGTPATAAGADASSGTSMHAKKRSQFQTVGVISIWLLVPMFLSST